MIMIIVVIAFAILMFLITLEHLNYLNLIQIDFFEKPYFKRDLRTTKKQLKKADQLERN